MEQFSLLNFLTVSIPEEFLMALFAWVILGKKGSEKIVNVFISGLIAAISFAVERFLFGDNLTFQGILQTLTFIVIIYFLYRLDFLEAILGSLVTLLAFGVIQSTVVSIGLTITGYSRDEFSTNQLLNTIFVLPEYIIIGAIISVIYFKNVKLFNFKKKKLNEYYSKKVRYLVLQLIFTFLILIINYRIFLYNSRQFLSNDDKLLLIINFSIIIVFSVLIVRSAYKMSNSILKEEELKRKLDGREIVQNIDYLCRLMDLKKYDEATIILKSMKEEVDYGMINNSNRANRGDSI